MANILSLNKLTKRYGSQTVLDAVDLLLPAGRIYGLIGLNGQGKTTLMRPLFGRRPRIVYMIQMERMSRVQRDFVALYGRGTWLDQDLPR